MLMGPCGMGMVQMRAIRHCCGSLTSQPVLVVQAGAVTQTDNALRPKTVWSAALSLGTALLHVHQGGDVVVSKLICVPIGPRIVALGPCIRH